MMARQRIIGPPASCRHPLGNWHPAAGGKPAVPLLAKTSTTGEEFLHGNNNEAEERE